MNCLECSELLQKRMDGEPISIPEKLERHLHECMSCREQSAAGLLLLEGTTRLRQPKLPANFASGIVAQVMHDRRQRQQKMRRRVFVTMALAASVLLMLFAAYWLIPPGQDDVPSKGQMVDNPKKDVPLPKDPITPKEEKKEEPRHALTALTERWADTTRGHAKVMLVAANLDTVPAVGEIPMLDPSVREAGQEVSDSVRTVTRSARRAFDFFARELPMPDVVEHKE